MFRQLLLSCLLVVSSLSGMVTTSIFTNSYEYDSGDYICDDSPYVSCQDNEREVTNKKESYVFVASQEIDSVKWEGEVTLSHYEIRNENEMTAIVTNYIDQGEITFHFYYQKEYVCSYALYFACSEDGTFYSSGRTLDCAKMLADQQVNYTFLSNDEEEEDELVTIEESTSFGFGTHGKVYGWFHWCGDDGESYPLVGARVTLRIGGSWYSQVTHTDEDGYYCFEYQKVWYLGSGRPTITLRLQNEKIKVKSSGVYAYKFKMAEKDTTMECSRTFTIEEDGDFAKAAALFQAGYLYSNFAFEHDEGGILKSCKIRYPSNYDTICYTENIRRINIPNTINENSPSCYMAWDTIGHEYCHHVQACHKIDHVSKHHNSAYNDIDYLIDRSYSTMNKVKHEGTTLSLDEGFATYWGVVAQQSFDPRWWYVPTVGDASYTSSGGANYSLDVYYDSQSRNLGDCQERAIARILYKLTSDKIDTYDRFALGFDTIWELYEKYLPTTMSEFINILYEQGYDKYDLGLLLGQYGVTPSSMNITNNSYDTCPTYTWSTSSGSKYFQYNEFDFVILSNEGEELINHHFVSDNDEDTYSYTLSEEEWQLIQNSTSQLYYAYLVMWQTDDFVTGGYYSNLYTFYLPRRIVIIPRPGDLIIT
ncbi:MAG: hypothetical protein LUC31_03180 [Coprobacillus sp.]|nr:hypothetical protein [Coprobacillus sp.]